MMSKEVKELRAQAPGFEPVKEVNRGIGNIVSYATVLATSTGTWYSTQVQVPTIVAIPPHPCMAYLYQYHTAYTSYSMLFSTTTGRALVLVLLR